MLGVLSTLASVTAHTVSYTEFKRMVGADEVAAVVVSESRIRADELREIVDFLRNRAPTRSRRILTNSGARKVWMGTPAGDRGTIRVRCGEFSA